MRKKLCNSRCFRVPPLLRKLRTELENRRYKDFQNRLAWYKTYLRKRGVNYSRIEKGVLGVKTLPIYHLGKDGAEYQKSEALKSKE